MPDHKATDVGILFNLVLCSSPSSWSLCKERGTKKGLLLPGSAPQKDTGERDLCKLVQGTG